MKVTEWSVFLVITTIVTVASISIVRDISQMLVLR